MLINLDTQIVIHFLDGRLKDSERSLVEQNDLGVCCIVLWEIAKLAQRGRILRDPLDPAMGRFLERCMIWPIDLAIAVQSTSLDFRSDPADEIIAATSIVHRAPLLTRDAKIRASKLVPLAS